MRDEETSGHSLHWLVLAVGLIAAIGLWSWWLNGGMGWGHGVVLKRVPTPVAASAPLPPASQASAPVLSTRLQAASSPETAPADRERFFTELGQTGDAFGSLNALLTAVAGALVAWAGFMQHQMLKQAKQEATAEREGRKIQQFESLFFQLLGLSAAVTERIEGPRRKGKVTSLVPGKGNTHAMLTGQKGPRALDAYARKVFNALSALPPEQQADQQRLEALVKYFLTEVYDKRPSAFGPYFRLLYQTFKHIHESTLTPGEQIRYANIARGQISEGAVLLLAINGLTYDGYKFVPLIEKFGLLEHLHRRYRAEFEPALQLGYRPRAFMGSEERAMPGNEWEDTPTLPQAYFQHFEDARATADAELEFEVGFDSDVEQDD